jgi:predicted esterase
MLVLALLLQAEDLPTLVRDYLAGNKALVEKIAARPVAEVERAIRASRVYEKREAGVAEHAVANAHDPAVPVRYLLRVPEYDPAKRYPMLVSLHGQGGNAKGQYAGWRREVEKEEDLFVLVPDAARGGWGRSRLGFGTIHAVIRDALARYPVDPNRVILDGGSMGGNGSFQFAAYFPDVFAGVAPRIGGPEFVKDASGKVTTARFLENFRNVPIYWIVGVKDEKCPIDWARAVKSRMEELKLDLTYREMDGGHEWFPQENPRVVEWLRGRKRDPYPKLVHWVTHERIWARAYWVEITGFSAKADERWMRTYVSDTNEKIEERLGFVHPVEVRAEIDREANAVRVAAKHVTELRLHVSDAMLDLDREITVFVDGAQKAKKKVTRSAKALLESAARDREMLFSASLDVKLK